MHAGQVIKDMEGINIETTSYCNRKCRYCPNYTIGRKNKLMEENLFYKIIDDLKKHDFQGSIEPTGYGEPLTDPRLLNFIKYIRKNLSLSTIGIATNGDFLTKENFLIFTYMGVNYFGVSNHVENPTNTAAETFRFVQKNYPFLSKNIYFNNIRLLINNKCFHNRCGLVDIATKQYERCPYAPIRQMNIDVNGNVLFCCHDYLAKHTFGNVSNEDLYEIWNNKKYVQFRNAINNGNLPYKMCKICTGKAK